jgi:hypothetical protein
MLQNRRKDPRKGPAIYFVAAPTRDHLPVFRAPEAAGKAVIQLGRAAVEHDGAIAGYAILPSGAMMIAAFRKEHDIGEFMYLFKRLSAMAIIGLEHGDLEVKLYRKGKFRPWMGRFDQASVNRADEFQKRLQYIHNEPVRRGLAPNPLDWPYSSARDWAGQGPGPIAVEKDLSWAGIF